jgi:MinD superfamily P-loop ATPase
MNTEKINKRVVFTMGGKGGVGKTGLIVALAEWFEAHEIAFTLLDLDSLAWPCLDRPLAKSERESCASLISGRKSCQ